MSSGGGSSNSNKIKNKLVTASLVALLTVALVGVAGAHTSGVPIAAAKGVAKNIKVQVHVTGIPTGTTSLIALLQVGGQGTPVQKIQAIDENSTDTTIMFNKIKGNLGDAFVVSVNGVQASGKLSDTLPNKPNKIDVKLS